MIEGVAGMGFNLGTMSYGGVIITTGYISLRNEKDAQNSLHCRQKFILSYSIRSGYKLQDNRFKL